MDEDLTTWDNSANDYLSVASETDEFKELVDDPAFMKLLGNIHGKRILDIGCGDGTLCGKLRANGAEVIGIDGSPHMIQNARAKDPEGAYSVVNVMQPFPFENVSFDIVTSKMMLMNVSSIKTVATHVREVLKDGGLFVVDVVHPFRPLLKSFTTAKNKYHNESDYFHEARGTITFAEKDYAFYFRPASQYVNEIVATGFTLRTMNELGVDTAFGNAHPDQQRKVNQPVSLHLLFTK